MLAKCAGLMCGTFLLPLDVVRTASHTINCYNADMVFIDNIHFEVRGHQIKSRIESMRGFRDWRYVSLL